MTRKPRQLLPTQTKTASEQRLDELAADIAGIRFALPGSVVMRTTRCGNSGCRCRADPPQPHGPYVSWTRKVDNKTVSRHLTPEQADRYRSWFENDRKLRQFVSELEALSLRTAEAAEGWGLK